MCTRSEPNWRRSDEHALRAMAQTRAISRALQGPLRQIVVLAKYAGAGAEEMPAEEPAPAAPKRSPAAPVEATKEQLREITRLITRLTELRPETDWKQRARQITGGPPELMTITIAKMLIGKLEESLKAAEEFTTAEGEF
jgi:hypothetical protein